MLDGARMRMARKPSALARELLRNFPKGKRRRGGRRRRRKGGDGADAAVAAEGASAAGQEQAENGLGKDDASEDASDEERSAA